MAISYFYVKAGGNAGVGSTEDNNQGIYSTPKTGSWESAFSGMGEYFDTVDDAISVTGHPMVTGDVICWSDASTDVLSGNNNVRVPSGVLIIAVDDSNVDQYAIATSEQVTQGVSDQLSFTAVAESADVITCAGIKWGGGGTLYLSLSESYQILREISARNTNSGQNIWATGQASSVLSICSDYTCGSSAGRMYWGSQSAELFVGGTITGGSAASSILSISSVGPDGIFVGVDFSGSAASIPIVEFGSASDALARYYLSGCKLPSGWTISNETNSPGYSVIIDQCDSRYQWYQAVRQGTIDFVTDVSYDNHDLLDDGLTAGSYEYDTNANANAASPLYMGSMLAFRCLAANNTEAATKTKVRLRFVTASGDTLNTGDVAAIVLYPESGAEYRQQCVDYWVSPMESANTLSTETGNWTGASLGTQYYLDIDMGSPGNGRVMVIPGVCKADVTVYFSWQLEFVA